MGAVTFVVALGVSAAGWRMARPGESMFAPIVVVTLTFGPDLRGVVSGDKALRGWRSQRVASTLVIAARTVPVLWTYVGVLPANFAGDANASRIIVQVGRDGAQVCHEVDQGSVRFLRASFQVCRSSYGRDSVVGFEPMDQRRGYAYVRGPIPANWFSDQCVLHFFGPWWSFCDDAKKSVMCPVGDWGDGGG